MIQQLHRPGIEHRLHPPDRLFLKLRILSMHQLHHLADPLIRAAPSSHHRRQKQRRYVLLGQDLTFFLFSQHVFNAS